MQLEVGQPLAGGNQRNVTCTMLDREGKPVENATVDLVAFAHLRASNHVQRFLAGRRRKVRHHAAEDPGRWEFRLVITRGGETFTQIVKREI